MSQSFGSISQWLQALVEGDERTVCEFWDQYGPRLNRLAERHLSPRLNRRVGAEDVVQSVCRTFFRRARQDQFQLADAEALWRLLCVITLTKCRLVARFHGRERRGLSREQPLDVAPGESVGIHDPVAAEMPPDQAAEVADVLANLLSTLDPEEQQMVDLRLQEHTNSEIAKQTGCSERTVRRIFQRVQTRLRAILDESSREFT